MAKTLYRQFEFKIENEPDEKGVFTGLASVWDVVDSYGDIVEKGAFKKTLKENTHFTMLWSHSIFEPLGIIHGKESDRGLEVEGHLNQDVQRAREIRSLMVQKAVNGLSIGYRVVKELIDRKEGIRRLKELAVGEISPCVFQACPGAVVEEVKRQNVELDFATSDLDRLVAEILERETLTKDDIPLLTKAADAIKALRERVEPGTAPTPAGEQPPADHGPIIEAVKGLRDYTRSLLQV